MFQVAESSPKVNYSEKRIIEHGELSRGPFIRVKWYSDSYPNKISKRFPINRRAWNADLGANAAATCPNETLPPPDGDPLSLILCDTGDGNYTAMRASTGTIC